MKKLLNQFKVNNSNEKSNALEILFDIAVVAIVSLIINGFIINNRSSVFDQKFFMMFNAGLLSIHWFVHTFFRQRYEKRNSFFRVWIFIQVFGLLIMALGIDLMAFRENSNNPNTMENYNFLRYAAMIVFLAGFILSRLVIFVQFLFVVIANKNNKYLIRLSLYKMISRLLTMLIAISHVTLVIIYKADIVEITTYVYMPIYLVIEIIGNVLKVNDDNIAKAPNVSLTYAKERYAKLALLFITSIFTSATIQFAFYFKNSHHLYMIGTLVMAYLIAFLIWWSYIDRVYRFGIKQNARNLLLYSIINILQAASLVLIGAMVINAHTNTNAAIIVPGALIGSSTLLFTYGLVTVTFMKGITDMCMERSVKVKYIFQVFPFMIVLFVLGIVSIYISLPIWVVYIGIIPSFMILNVMSRITITRHVKSKA